MWLTAFLGVIILDVDVGLYVALVYSLLVLIYKSSRPKTYLLGSVNKTDVYVPLKHYGSAAERERVKIYQFCGPLHFASLEFFRKDLIRKTRVSVADVIAKRKKQQEKQVSAKAINNNDTESGPPVITIGDIAVVAPEQLPTHIIIDCSMFSYIDTSGVTMLKKTVQAYESIGITTFLASCASHVIEMLERDKFFVDVPPHHVYISLHDAVLHAIGEQSSAMNGGLRENICSSITTSMTTVVEELKDDEDASIGRMPGEVKNNGSFTRNRH